MNRQLITSVKVTAVIFDVVSREKSFGNIQVQLEIERVLAVVGKTVVSRCGKLLRNVPEFVDGDVFVFVHHTIVVLIRISPVELEELHEFIRDCVSVHLFADIHSPLDELVHRNGAISVFVSRLHQEGEGLLLTGVSVVIEFVTRLDGGGAGELLDDRLVVLEVDHAIAVHVVSVSEEELQFLSKEVSHGSCLSRFAFGSESR